MASLIIFQGPPASGKTTQAKIMADMGGNVVRLNRDLLREMLHFGEYSFEKEQEVIQAEFALAIHFLEQDYDVIIDDTNSSKDIMKTWEKVRDEVDAHIEVVKLDTSVEECIARDSKREKPVGKEAILRIARFLEEFHT